MQDDSPVQPPPTAAAPSMAGALVRGTAWSVGTRWAARFLGIVNLAICARILSPEDFGLVSMATVVVGFSMVLFDFGLETALIRNQGAGRDHYDTAWSIRLAEVSLVGALVMISAPFVAGLYEDSRVRDILIVLGAFIILSGFQSIRTVDFRKSLDFRRDFQFIFVPRISSFLVGVCAVIYLETYWGLVFGICAGHAAKVLYSYVMIPVRPRLTFVKWREILGFSIWFMLQGMARFVTTQLDRFFIGVLGGAREVGLYGVAREVGELPVSELAMPISRALTPTLSKLNETPDRLRSAVDTALGGLLIVAAPLAVGFMLVAREFILILFGEKWVEAIPVTEIICLSAVFTSFFAIALNIMVIIGRVRQSAVLGWCQAGATMALIYPAYLQAGITGVAWMTVGIGAVMAATVTVHFHRLGMLRGWRSLANFARPLAAAAAMYAAVWACAPAIPDSAPIALVLKALIGAPVYAGVLLALWALSGRPASAERLMLQLTMQQAGRVLRALRGRTG